MSPAAFAVAATFALAGCVSTRGGTPRDIARAGFTEEGIASWYGMQGGRVFEHGKLTASGRRYDQHALTAAHKTLPLGTRLSVTNLENGRRIVVVVNDRGPYIDGRIVDLTLRGARLLGFEDKGMARVRIEVVR